MANYREYRQKKTLPRMQRKQSRNLVWAFNKKANKKAKTERIARDRSLQSSE